MFKKRLLFILVFLLIHPPTPTQGFGPFPGEEKQPAEEQTSLYKTPVQARELQSIIEQLAEDLVKDFLAGSADVTYNRLILTTFVDLNNLTGTSSFGRFLTEELMTILKEKGFVVVEIRKTTSVLIKPRFGEYGLSSDVKEIETSLTADAMLAGTYLKVADHVFVNARIINNRDASLLASANAVFRENPLLKAMLADAASPVKASPVKKQEGVIYLKRLEF